jgi:hypothetical protein
MNEIADFLIWLAGAIVVWNVLTFAFRWITA